MNTVQFGIKLRELRDSRNLTRPQVAKHFNFKGTKQVERWEAGELAPSIEQIYELSSLYKTDLFRIFSEMLETEPKPLAELSLNDLAEMLEVLQAKLAANREYLSKLGGQVENRKPGEILTELDKKAASFFERRKKKGNHLA